MLVRNPQLKLAYSEGQIGWIPYILERADDVWVEHRAWGGVQGVMTEPPSTYYHRQIFGCFFRDRHGLESLHRVGVDNVTFETDYPHTDSTWPHTKKLFEEQVARSRRRDRLQDRPRQRHPHAPPAARPLTDTSRGKRPCRSTTNSWNSPRASATGDAGVTTTSWAPST